ncbi:hypothetical protein BT93_B0566 [Corymbia citriodora subsp. variegata]|nr:hypothetical protein BT93_B0566 [Corymbia citriodora subsp. variegata]
MALEGYILYLIWILGSIICKTLRGYCKQYCFLLHRQTPLETLSHELLLAETFDLERLQVEIKSATFFFFFLLGSITTQVGFPVNHERFFICKLRGIFWPPFNFLIVFRE